MQIYVRSLERNKRKILLLDMEAASSISDSDNNELTEQIENCDLSGIQAMLSDDGSDHTLPVLEGPEVETSDASCQTEMPSADISKLQFELRQRNTEIDELRKKVLQTSLSEKSFKNNDEKVLFYTGHPNFALIMTLFHFLESFVTNTAITNFNSSY